MKAWIERPLHHTYLKPDAALDLESPGLLFPQRPHRLESVEAGMRGEAQREFDQALAFALIGLDNVAQVFHLSVCQSGAQRLSHFNAAMATP